MTFAKNFLSTAVFFFSAVSVFAQVELHDSGSTPLLINKPDPVLSGVEPFCVVVLHSDTDLRKSDLLWKNLKTRAEADLKKAGLQIIAIPDNNFPPEIPELRITIDLLRHENSNRYFLHIQTSLARLVYIEKDGSVAVKADVWKIGPAMEVSAIENIQTVASRLVSKQMDVFISTCVAANPANKSSDPNAAKVVQTPAGKSAPAKFHYVASKTGKVFHKADCIWAARIKPENLVGYNTRQDALDAGKKPCSKCKP